MALRLLLIDAQLAADAEWRHAVHQPEIDRLRGPPMVSRDLVRFEIENLGGCSSMHVEIVTERAAQPLVTGQVRHDAQFDLRIVRREQHLAIGWHECLPDFAAFRCPDRDVLQVRVCRGQPPRGGNGLVIGRMDSAGRRSNLFGQFVGVCALQLADTAVLEDDPGKVVVVRRAPGVPSSAVDGWPLGVLRMMRQAACVAKQDSPGVASGCRD